MSLGEPTRQEAYKQFFYETPVHRSDPVAGMQDTCALLQLNALSSRSNLTLPASQACLGHCQRSVLLIHLRHFLVPLLSYQKQAVSLTPHAPPKGGRLDGQISHSLGPSCSFGSSKAQTFPPSSENTRPSLSTICYLVHSKASLFPPVVIDDGVS